MKVIFGGAFNPPTVAHQKLYYFIDEKLDITEFIYIPVSSFYTKSSLVSNNHRVSMLKLMVKDLDKASISLIEINDTDYRGTYEALSRLRDTMNEDIAFLIGADNLLELDSWLHVNSLLSEFKIIVIDREGINISKIINNNYILKKYESSFIILQGFNFNVSSTEFRKTFKKGLVTEEVYDYIIEHGLYKEV